MILKIILAALCANLLYTNANLMLSASSELATWQSWMMVIFAITYSLISTLSIFKMQSLFAIVCFAILDGAAVYLHFADHGANFKMIVAVYFGIYTAYTLIVAFAIKRNEDAEGSGNEIPTHTPDVAPEPPHHSCLTFGVALQQFMNKYSRKSGVQA